MGKRSLALLVFLLFLDYAYSQYFSGVTVPDTSDVAGPDSTDLSYQLAQSILAEDLEKHLSILASDEFEGRETGEPGNDKAAKYIADHFRNIGLPGIGLENSYTQEVAFTWTKWEHIHMQVDTMDYLHLKDFIGLPHKNQVLKDLNVDEVIFLGFGIDDPHYSDYKGNKVRDKVIMIYQGEPMKADSTYWITGSSNASAWSSDPRLKLIAAKNHGAKLVLIIEPNIQARLFTERSKLLRPVLEIGDKTGSQKSLANSIYINTNIARQIIGEKITKVSKSRDRSHKKGKACDVKLKQDLSVTMDISKKVIKSANVLGYIEGSDKKEELIVITAHYDHLGKRGDDNIYNGANDNGSGTTAVMEIAEAFALAKASGHSPRRSILCMLVTGEEKGLLGSEYYTTSPIFPLDQTIANINVDMVGRTDTYHDDTEEYIYVIGSDRISTDLHRINEEANEKYSRLILDYTYNSESDPNRFYYRSDHYNFAKNGIPSIFYFNGTHKDYHRTTDTVEKMQFDKMEKVCQLIFHTAWALANKEGSLVIDRLP